MKVHNELLIYNNLPIHFSSSFMLFMWLTRLIKHPTDVHMWNHNSDSLFWNILITSRSVCRSSFRYRLHCFHLPPPFVVLSAHTQCEVGDSAACFLPFATVPFLIGMKNNFHRTRYSIFHGGHETKVSVFLEHYQCTIMSLCSPVYPLTPTRSMLSHLVFSQLIRLFLLVRLIHFKVGLYFNQNKTKSNSVTPKLASHVGLSNNSSLIFWRQQDTREFRVTMHFMNASHSSRRHGLLCLQTVNLHRFFTTKCGLSQKKGSRWIFTFICHKFCKFWIWTDRYISVHNSSTSF